MDDASMQPQLCEKYAMKTLLNIADVGAEYREADFEYQHSTPVCHLREFDTKFETRDITLIHSPIL